MNDGLPNSDMMIGRRVPPRKAATKPRTPARRTPRTAPVPAAKGRILPTIVIQDLEDFNESVNVLVYGDSGVGKTPFAAMAPNAVILSTEKGAISAKRFGSKAKLIKAPTWDHVEAALDFVDELQKGPKRRDWMVVDSTTKMQELMLRWILQGEVEENGSRDLDIPQIQNHQKWQNMFKRFIDRIIDMDINVIFVATAMHKEDPEGEDLVMPNIVGKDYAIAQYVCAQMDGVYCLKAYTDKKTDEPFWKLLTKTRPPYFAKDRYNALPGVVVKPTMQEVITAILESAEISAAIETKPKAGTPIDDDWEEDTDDDEAEEEEEEEEDADDDDEEEDPEEEAEPTPTPARRRTPPRTPSKAARGRRAQSRAVEEDTGDDDADEEEDPPAPARRTRRSSVGVGTKVYDDPVDEDEEDSPPAKPLTRAQKLAAQRKARAEAKKSAEEAEEDDSDDDDDDGEDSQETHNRAANRRQSKVSRPAVRRQARKPKATKVVDEDDLFDPDDTDDDDPDFD